MGHMSATPDFSRLPEPVRLEATVTSVDTTPIQAPEGERNQALWEAQEAGG